MPGRAVPREFREPGFMFDLFETKKTSSSPSYGFLVEIYTPVTDRKNMIVGEKPLNFAKRRVSSGKPLQRFSIAFRDSPMTFVLTQMF
jgi:hypothetical protein